MDKLHRGEMKQKMNSRARKRTDEGGHIIAEDREDIVLWPEKIEE